jgi:hypothetical protein
MRAILMLAVFTVASMPPMPLALSTDAPRILVQTFDCAAAQLNANVIGAALGYSQARVSCGGSPAKATLEEPAAERFPVINSLIAYNLADRTQSLASVETPFKVPSDVPFVAATGSIVALVKLDAFVMSIRTDNALETAFALENAGIPRGDMVSDTSDEPALLVRVRPITGQQVLRIERIAKERQRDQGTLVYFTTGFVRDCNGVVASLGAAALTEARERARVMARAAQTGLGNVLGVIDLTGYVTDAVCGFGSDATIRQLAAARDSASPSLRHRTSPLHATIIRSISAAWRLPLPPNPPGSPWYNDPDFFGRWWITDPQPAFISDGARAHGEAAGPEIEPTRVSIRMPDWAYAPLIDSPYATDLEYSSLGLSPYYPVVEIRAKGTSGLERVVAGVQSLVSGSAPRAERLSAWEFAYGRDDCRPEIYAALYRATLNAIAGTHDKPIRYLQETEASSLGNFYCTPAPMDDAWTDLSMPRRGVGFAKVIAGY